MSEYTKITVEKARISENFATHGWNYVCTIVQVDTLKCIRHSYKYQVYLPRNRRLKPKKSGLICGTPCNLLE